MAGHAQPHLWTPAGLNILMLHLHWSCLAQELGGLNLHLEVPMPTERGGGLAQDGWWWVKAQDCDQRDRLSSRIQPE